MYIRKIVLRLAVLGLGLAQLSFAQVASQARPSSQRVLGYLDPATGIFQAVHPTAEIDPATALTETGELLFKFTITVKATIPKNAVISCSGHANTGDTAGEYGEDATGIATLVSGTTYTCSAIIHYSWLLNTPTTDPVLLSGGTTLEYGYQATAFNGSDTVVEPVGERVHGVSLPELKAIPANGATTTIAVNVTL